MSFTPLQVLMLLGLLGFMGFVYMVLRPETPPEKEGYGLPDSGLR